MKKIFFILSLLFLLEEHCWARNIEGKVAPGTPVSVKFWDAPDEKYEKDINQIFGGRDSRYRYFAALMTNFSEYSTKNQDVAYYTVAPGISIFDEDVQVLDTIFMAEYFKKNHRRHKISEGIRVFLETNYKIQFLPGYVYENDQHLPRPLYLGDLRDLAFSAIDNDDLNMLRALLDNYSLVNVKNKQGYGLLSYSVLNSKNDIAMFMIRRGANINETNHLNETPIMVASRSNNVEMLEILSDAGCAIKSRNVHVQIPLGGVR